MVIGVIGLVVLWFVSLGFAVYYNVKYQNLADEVKNASDCLARIISEYVDEKLKPLPSIHPSMTAEELRLKDVFIPSLPSASSYADEIPSHWRLYSNRENVPTVNKLYISDKIKPKRKFRRKK